MCQMTTWYRIMLVSVGMFEGLMPSDEMERNDNDLSIGLLSMYDGMDRNNGAVGPTPFSMSSLGWSSFSGDIVLITII